MARNDSNQNSLGVPDDVFLKLAEADDRHGFPAGTMQSIMQQEIGGQLDRFLGDPTSYHYDADASGRRVAPNGKISTAFGPFGILESTAADPGFGVSPLRDKSFDSQLDFAANYLKGRSNGDLSKGLASYGEGKKYANQVLARLGGQDTARATTNNPKVAREQPIKLPAKSTGSKTAPSGSKIPIQDTSFAALSKSVQGSKANASTATKRPTDIVTSLAQLGISDPGIPQQSVPVPKPLGSSIGVDNRQAALRRLSQIAGTEVIL